MRTTIDSQRLTLRPFEDADAPRLAALINHADVARMTSSVPHPYPPEIAAGWILIARARERLGEAYDLAVDVRGVGLVGGCGLFHRGSAADWELGYWIAPDHQGRGYASEAVAAILSWAERELALDQVTAGHFHDNPASRRVLEKCGFEPTGAVSEVFAVARGGRAACIDMVRPLRAMAATA